MSPVERSAFPGRAMHAACLRPTAFPAEPHFTDAIDRLRRRGTCVLAHEQEYGTAALYVHSPTALSDAFPAELLSAFDAQPQLASIFRLSPPFDGEAIQRALNACAARHAGINAAAVDAGSGRLTVFRDPPAPLSGGRDSCAVGVTFPAAGIRAQGRGAVLIHRPHAAAQGLESMRRSLQSHPALATYTLSIEAEVGAVSIQPHRDDELPSVLRLVAALIEERGMACELVRNRRAVRPARRAVAPVCCMAEIEIPAAAGGDYASYPDPGAGPPDAVPLLLAELGCTARLLEGPREIAFPLGGVKCAGCANRVTTALRAHLPRHLQASELSLTLMRDAVLTTLPSVEAEGFLHALKEAAQATGIPCGPPSVLPPALWEDLEKELRLHTSLAQPSDTPTDSSEVTVAEVALRTGSLGCGHCTAHLKRVLLTVAGVSSVTTNASEASLSIEHTGGTATVERAVGLLARFGFEPATVRSGAPPPPPEVGAWDPLSVHSSPSLPSSDSDTVGPPSLTPEPFGGSMSYTVTLHTAQGPLDTELLLTGTSDTCHALLVKEPTGGYVHVDQYPVPLLLESEYTMWYDKVVDRSKPDAPEGTLIELESFRTLQEFWRIWTNFDLAGLQEGDVLMVFRRAVQPNIHHPVNKAGGRWYTRALPVEVRGSLWSGLVVAMLGEHLRDQTANAVCGVVLSVKPGGDRIEVWVDGDYHHPGKLGEDPLPATARLSGPTMGDLLAQVLQLNPGRHRLHYWTHVAYERHRKLHSGSARRDKRKHKMAAGGC